MNYDPKCTHGGDYPCCCLAWNQAVEACKAQIWQMFSDRPGIEGGDGLQEDFDKALDNLKKREAK